MHSPASRGADRMQLRGLRTPEPLQRAPLFESSDGRARAHYRWKQAHDVAAGWAMRAAESGGNVGDATAGMFTSPMRGAEKTGLVGPFPEGDAPSGGRAERVALALFVVVLAVTLGFVVHPWFEPVRDASIYVSTARSLLAGDGYSYLGVPFITRPPGFSLLLAPVIALFGTSFRALNLYVGLFGAVAVVLFFVWMRPRLGWPPALAVALLLWFNPGFRRLSNEIMSDVPGLAAALVCLLVARWASRAPSWRREVVLGLAIGLSMHVRSLSALLLPAIVLSRLALGGVYGQKSWRLERARLKTLVALVLAALAVTVPWALRNRAVRPTPPMDQVAVYSYASAMWHQDFGDPDSPRLPWRKVLERVPKRTHEIADGLGSRLRDGIPYARAKVVKVRPGAGAVAALLLLGLTYCLLRYRGPAELFAVGNLAVVLVYFDFRARLLLPLFAIALASTAVMLRDLGRRFASARLAEGIVVVAALVCAAVDLAPRQDWERIEWQHRSLVARADAVRLAVPPEARLATALGFYDALFLERPVYSLSLAVRRAGSPEAIEAVIDRYGVDTLILSTSDTAESSLLDFVRTRYPDEVQIASDLFLIRVRPRDAAPPTP